MTILDKKRKTPLVFKVLIRSIPILIFAVWFISMQRNGVAYKKKFLNEEISAIVIKSNSYYGRSEEFHLANGLKLYFLLPVDNKIMIGDSIRKEPNTYFYDVYRKSTTGEYKFLATYNFEETL